MSGLEIFAIIIILASIPAGITLLCVLAAGYAHRELAYFVALVFISIMFVIDAMMWAMGKPFPIGGGA